MRAALQNEAERFQQELEALYRENYQLIYRAAYGVMRNAEDAEDVLQTVFVTLIQAPPPSDFSRNPKGYLYRTAINSALKTLRSRQSRKLADDDVDSMEIAAPEHDDRIDPMRRAIAKMKPSVVEMVNLRYKEGCSCREIAKITGKPVGRVGVELLRARAELKRLIGIQETYRETQESKYKRNRGPNFPDSPPPGDGSSGGKSSQPPAGGTGETRHIGPLFIR